MNDTQDRLRDAKLALDRAHSAARDANGANLRRSLNDAINCLDGQAPEAVKMLTEALRDLDVGALVELDRLLEDARRQISKI